MGWLAQLKGRRGFRHPVELDASRELAGTFAAQYLQVLDRSQIPFTLICNGLRPDSLNRYELVLETEKDQALHMLHELCRLQSWRLCPKDRTIWRKNSDGRRYIASYSCICFTSTPDCGALLIALCSPGKRKRIKAEMATVGRMLSNLFSPTGKTVLFLGSDGSGKSTVIEKQRVFFEPFYQETRGIRFRHGIFPKLKGGAFFRMPENPGGDQFAYPDKYIWPGIVYYTLSTWVGNRALNCLRRGDCAVFIDRYYYDFFIHKATKDFMFAHQWLLHFVRKPDLVIYLTADAEIIRQRKPELSTEELLEQDRAILRLIPHIAPVHVIDSSNQTLEQTSRTAFGIITEAFHGQHWEETRDV